MNDPAPGNPHVVLSAVKAAALLASVAVLGWEAYGANNELQLALVQHANQAGLYPGDPFVRTLSHYASALWQVMWIPFRFIPETPLLLVLIGLQRLFCLYAAGRLARALGGGNPVAEAAAWCLLAFGMQPFLGWGTVLPDYFEHTSLAVAGFLLCVTALIEGAPYRAGIWLGLMGLANVMHAAHAIPLLTAAVLVTPGLRRFVTVRAAGVALLVMSPAIYLALRAMDQPAIPDSAFVRLLWFYVPQHFFPSSWTGREWMVAGLGLLGVLGAWAARQVSPSSRRLLIGLCVGYGLTLAGAALAERSGRAGLINLQLARASDLWTPVAALFVLATLVNAAQAAPGRARRQIVCALGVLALMMIWVWRVFVGWFALLSVPAAIAMWATSRAHRPTLRQLSPLVVPLWALAVFSFLGLSSRHHYGLLGIGPRPEWPMARWAQAHTPESAVFLVDPAWGGFRILARRSSFVTWKDGAAMLWQPQFASYWVPRLRAIGVDPLTPGLNYPASLVAASQAFMRLSDEQAQRLARDFAVDYWIVPLAKPSRLPIAHQDENNKILVLSPAREGQSTREPANTTGSR